MDLRLPAIAMAVALTAGAAHAQVNLKVMGQPGSTGLIMKNFEQPFFENFAEKTGVDANVTYTPVDVTGVKEPEQLRLLKSGLFDIIGLRLGQVSRDEPTILGLDLVGQNPDYETAKKTITAFMPVVDKQLQAKFNTKLLGVWPFGPQVLFCEPEIAQLADLSGKKVRVYDQSLANFISSVGGTPVPIGFSEVHQSLARGVIDCAVTGPSSANTAGWPEETSYMLPIAFQVAVQGYGINLNVWNKFSAEEQEKIQAAFDELTGEIWAYSEEIFNDAVRCNVGEEPCETVKLYDLTRVPISDADKEIIQGALTNISFPAWKEICDAVNPTCSADWMATVGAALGLE
ncbi:TRAP transporter substrate-binding protein [Acuticoccus yangtzensis]|uniref:TRAP transporter substrate-binding protein n=1 Tax=Acuticoccus yangtzensis TaxID=1443441 RepID=UPI0009499C91|nr:TRAP transporter substrate-binding protein [Acuticoccus yangtzensis]ORE96179.1 TRAP dicarboxylate transporter subunit DctP [Stappia sp. 22II-S9-Z10]